MPPIMPPIGIAGALEEAIAKFMFYALALTRPDVLPKQLMALTTWPRTLP